MIKNVDWQDKPKHPLLLNEMKPRFYCESKFYFLNLARVMFIVGKVLKSEETNILRVKECFNSNSDYEIKSPNKRIQVG